jgi:hypothetical protein
MASSFSSPGQGGPLPPPGADQNPGAGGGFPSPSEQTDPGDSQLVARLVQQISAASRRLGLMYPAALEETRTINAALQRMQGKIVNSKPAPEPLAPPV